MTRKIREVEGVFLRLSARKVPFREPDPPKESEVQLELLHHR